MRQLRGGGRSAHRATSPTTSPASGHSDCLRDPSFAQPFVSLVQDWWSLPEAGHGLLLAPVAVWLAWQSGIRAGAAPSRALGLTILVFAVLIRCAAGLAAELFTMRASMMIAIVGLTVYHYGVRQVLHWWLPLLLGCLSIPLPELVTQALALPLQFRASRMGAAPLASCWSVPVRLAWLRHSGCLEPGGSSSPEACSGLRSLTALLSVAVLTSALLLPDSAGARSPRPVRDPDRRRDQRRPGSSLRAFWCTT